MKLVRNLVPPTQPLPASSVPLVPFMAPAVNYAVPSPLLPVAALIQVAVPGSAGFPVGMTPIFQVPSSPLQISPTRFGYISERYYSFLLDVRDSAIIEVETNFSRKL